VPATVTGLDIRCPTTGVADHDQGEQVGVVGPAYRGGDRLPRRLQGNAGDRRELGDCVDRLGLPQPDGGAAAGVEGRRKPTALHLLYPQVQAVQSAGGPHWCGRVAGGESGAGLGHRVDARRGRGRRIGGGRNGVVMAGGRVRSVMVTLSAHHQLYAHGAPGVRRHGESR
jgi:hypothetical protein